MIAHALARNDHARRSTIIPLPGAGAATIPAYALYGEDGALPDSVHAETIEARSARLDWRIGAHRHATLYQALLIRDGSANASIEGRPLMLGPLPGCRR